MGGDSNSAKVVTHKPRGALTFALLFSLESLTRSFNASVLPIQAYDLLGSSRSVSILSTVVAICVLAATLMLPVLLGGLRRRWTYTIGVSLMIAAAACLSSYTLAGQVVGAFLRSAGASILAVTLSLYIMDHIERSQLVQSESLRLTLSTFSWCIGPALGVFLYTTFGPIAPQLASMATAITLLIVFWRLRLSANDVLPPGLYERFQPINNLRKFIAQPRLRLAWVIAFGRSCFWSALFIYGPLLMIEGNLGKQTGGLLVSASQVLLIFAFVFGRIGIKHGVRPVVTLSFLMLGVTTAAAGLVGVNNPFIAAVLLLLGAFFATGLDGVGGVPFLRAVKPRDRARMTPVYRTFLELSELLPGLVFAFVLSIFPTQAVFVVISLLMFALSVVSWKHLPKSL
jgi:MFS family permease